MGQFRASAAHNQPGAAEAPPTAQPHTTLPIATCSSAAHVVLRFWFLPLIYIMSIYIDQCFLRRCMIQEQLSVYLLINILIRLHILLKLAFAFVRGICFIYQIVMRRKSD